MCPPRPNPCRFVSMRVRAQVPRRPVWSQGITAAELDRMEKDAFLAWRRNIAELEEANDGTAKVRAYDQ